MRAADVCQAAGISYRQLDWWTRNGYVDSTRLRGLIEKSGYPRDYPDGEVAVVVRIARLLKAGLTLHAAVVVARRMVDLGRDDITVTLGPADWATISLHHIEAKENQTA